MLRIQRHGRILEWVAEELGFFREGCLEFEIAGHRSDIGDHPHPSGVPIPEDPHGLPSAYCEFLRGSISTNVASTSHWAVAAAVSSGYGELWPHAYGLMPAGIYVQPGIEIRHLQDLFDLEIVVGRHSGSHFSAVYALHDFIQPEEIRFKFVEGRTARLKALLAHEAPAGSIYGLEAYILEQRGFQRVIDTTFMVSYMIVGSPDPADVVKYFEAMRCAQAAVDENPHKYRHYLLAESPREVRQLANVHQCGVGERVEFARYGKGSFLRAREWVISEEIIPRSWIGSAEPDQCAD